MKNKVLFYISIFASLFLLALILTFKTTPQSQLWKEYKILYVPKSIDVAAVEKIIDTENITGVVSKNSQRVPVVSKFAPVQIQTSSSYLLRREGFFTDKSNSFNVFYIPEKYASKISIVIERINKSFPDEKQKSGTDGEGKTSILPLVIAVLSCIAVAFFCENKVAFLVLAFSPLVFVFSNPFFCVSGAFLLSLVAFYAIQKIYNRKGAFSILRKSALCYIFLIAPGIILAFSYIKLSLFYFLAVVSSLANFNVFMALKKVIDSKIYSFNPSLILSAKSISVPGARGKNVLKATAVSMFVLLISAIFAGGLSSKRATVDSSLNLPLPVAKANDNALPNATDFSVWAWNTLAFPFKRLSKTNLMNSENSIPQEGEKVDFLGVAPLNDKVLSDSYNSLVYNNSFRQSLYKSAEENDGSIEKLILAQGEKSEFTYGKQVGTAKENFKVLILTLFLFASVGATLFYTVLGNKNGQ